MWLLTSKVEHSQSRGWLLPMAVAAQAFQRMRRLLQAVMLPLLATVLNEQLSVQQVPAPKTQGLAALLWRFFAAVLVLWLALLMTKVARQLKLAYSPFAPEPESHSVARLGVLAVRPLRLTAVGAWSECQ
jgi:hypothetical protein